MTLDPLLVQHVGRVSGVIDAHLLGLPGDLGTYRPRYDDAERLSAVHKVAQAMGKRAFQRRTGLPATIAERAAAGCPIGRRNLAKALRALRIDDGSTHGAPRSTAVSTRCSEPAPGIATAPATRGTKTWPRNAAHGPRPAKRKRRRETGTTNRRMLNDPSRRYKRKEVLTWPNHKGPRERLASA